MPSQTSNSRSSGAASSTTRTPFNKRQARAARRAYERRRRTRILQTVVVIVVVAGIVTLFVTHNPFASNGQSTVHTTATSCPAPTATPVGPVPALKPPQSPPTVSGTTVDGSQGLKYIDVKVGCGNAVKTGDNVTVIYHGWLKSTGKLFDSSYLHGGTYQVQNIGQAQVISGWNLGLIGMKPGGTRRLIIPPELGYGAQGQPPTIPANSTLIFDITLVSIDS
ncbi:MAG: peptidylprolyl isomerase [Chloroflexi bacterium]|nr:MAG: peptidylprolyl isomerase [Chloroflexota bacterium]